MIKIRFIGKRPYRLVKNNMIIDLKPGQILTLSKVQAMKIKASKFRKYFEVVSDEPTLEDRIRELSRLINEDVRDAIISLRNRVSTLEALHP